MLNLFLAPFQFPFMVNAIAISIVVAIPCALLSVFLVLKGWALMGDAMSHAVFPGVVLAYIIGIPFAIGAFIAGLLCAVTTGFLDDNSRLKRDTIMGIVFSGMFGAGLVLYVAIQSDVHLDHILFGDMLGISLRDIGQTTAIALVIALIIGLKWRDFLLHAFDPAISIVVAIPCALLSVFLVLKGWALMGDAMSHAVFPGVVLAYIIGIPFAIGAFIAGLLCAVTTGFLDDNSRLKRDTIMGIVFSGMFGAGLVLYVAIQSDVHLDHILFGDMLGISLRDIGQTTAIALVIALIIGLKWRDFLLHAFDPTQAKASGLRGGLLHYGLLCMIALTIVATLQSVGIILSISLLIAPGAIALLLVRRFIHALLLAVAVAIGCSAGGVWLAFYLDSAPAPTIVVLFTALFVVAFVASTIRDSQKQKTSAIIPGGG